MGYTLNTTKDYHVNQINTLGWELTICNALYPEQTPLRKMLRRNDSFGHLLYDYLSRFVPMGNIRKVIEIGGGYGYLMNDFLDRNGTLQPCVTDISLFLLGKQKEALSRYSVSYREEDFLETDPSILAGFDLAILNENLGDFPSLTNLNRELLQSSHEILDTNLITLLHLIEKYKFDLPEDETFNLNIGAVLAVERLCVSGIPYIYLGEHSCEALAPEALRSIVHIESTGSPERIPLMGHDEYTIKFSYLEKVARASGYDVIRGPFADFVCFDLTDRIKSILWSRGQHSDEEEIICQFVEDLYKYEYLILTKKHVR